MSWSDCGTDSHGRPIGYGWTATCDHPGCKAEIDRGLSYACGGMHGDDEKGCERYFCEDHLYYTNAEDDCRMYCAKCSERINADAETREDERGE